MKIPKLSKYRIKRRTCGDYEVHRRKFLMFWIHDGSNRRLKSDNRATSFRYWYDTYEQAKNGVAARIDFDQRAATEGGTMKSKIFYQPFPEVEK